MQSNQNKVTLASNLRKWKIEVWHFDQWKNVGTIERETEAEVVEYVVRNYKGRARYEEA